MGEYAAAQAVLDDAEISHDIIYDQLYEQIEGQQDARFDEYVMNAKSSLNFLIENGLNLGLTQPTIDQLATTLAVIEYGTNSEIDAATGQIGITLSVLPNDLSLPSSFTTGSGFGEQLKSKLPPGIAKKYGYSTDSNLGAQSTDGTSDGNGDSVVPGFDAAGDNPSDNPSDIAQATGVGLGGTPPGLFNIGWSPDDWWGSWSFDDFASPFGDDFEPGAKGRAIAAEKAAEGLAKARQESEGRAPAGIPEPPGGPPGGPPCGSPPCGGPP